MRNRVPNKIWNKNIIEFGFKSDKQLPVENKVAPALQKLYFFDIPRGPIGKPIYFDPQMLLARDCCKTKKNTPIYSIGLFVPATRGYPPPP